MRRTSSRSRAIALTVLGVASTIAFSPTAAQGPMARVTLPGYEVPILLDTLSIATRIGGSRDSIFSALSQVFTDLGIKVEEKDHSAGLLRNLGVEKYRRLGKAPLSRYFDCGRGFSGANADVYRITIALSAWVEPPAGASERLHVAVVGSGRDPAGSASGAVKCNSTGRLEAFIAEQVSGKLAGQAPRDGADRAGGE